MTPNANVAPPAQQPGWFARNWKWLLPVGCLVPLLCCGTFGAVTYLGVSKVIEGSVAFKTGLDKASANPDVIAALGSPLKTGLGVTGSINETNGNGVADFSMPIEGPKGKGTLVVKGRGTGNTWTYERLEVQVGGKTIDLMAQEEPPEPEGETPSEPEPEEEPDSE